MALQALITEFGEHLEELNEREKLLLIQIIAYRLEINRGFNDALEVIDIDIVFDEEDREAIITLDSAPKPLLLDLIATLAAQIKG